MPQFDPRTIPLTGGTHLIEASAGTGKTYGIAALFTRLILEGRDIARIIVVTFTEAAAAELKTRLRMWLDAALTHLHNPQQSQAEPLQQQLIQDAQQQHDTHTLIQRLELALNAFDTAAIYTIHGFCLRVLNDQALLCGTPFDIQINRIPNSTLLAAIQDFWRSHIANNPVHTALVSQHRLTPQSLLEEMRPYSQQPHLQRPNAEMPQLQQHQQQREQAWQQLLTQLQQVETAFWQMHPKLNARSYNTQSYQTIFAQLHAIRPPEAQTATQPNPTAADNLHQLELFKPKKSHTQNLQRETLIAKHKKGHEADPVQLHALEPLLQLVQTHQSCIAAEEQATLSLKLQILQLLDQTIEADKQQHNRRDFNDLLLDLHHALHHSPHSDTLARAMAEQCDAILIDEFQDTDPLQYAIFQTAFIQQGLPVFLVGDPKQAIYGFRGADIQAYLAAAADTPEAHRHTLSDNYRSSQGIIDAVAALFNRPQPFVLPNIPYVPVSAKRGQGHLKGELAALTIHHLNTPDQNETKENLRQKSADHCANDIAHLLNRAQQGHLKLDTQNLQPQDIAILVRTHKEAQRMRRSLRQRGIRSVLLQQQSVFHTPQARAIAALLQYFLEPQHLEPLRYVLGGILYQYNATQLTQFNQNPSQIARWIQWAQEAAQIWQQKGIFNALAHFSQQTELEIQMLRRRDERSLTDFWHLAELLAAEAFQHASAQALLTWLQHKIQNSEQHTQHDSQLRLESDENLVKIITMHAAKGLEYPIVFCPFAWDAPTPRNKQTWYTVRRDQQTWLLPSAQLTAADRTQLQTDQLGESLRLLYVALTRAREALIIYSAAQSNSTPHNPLAYLLAPDHIHAENYSAHWQADKTALNDQLIQAWQNKLASLTDHHWRTQAPSETHYHPHHNTPQTYTARQHPKRTWHSPQHSSFTALSHTTPRPPEAPIKQATPSQHPTTPSQWEQTSHITPTHPPRPPQAPTNAPTPSPHQHTLSLWAHDEEKASDHTAIPDPSLQVATATPETPLLAFPKGSRAGICLHRILELADFQQNTESQLPQCAQILQDHGYDDSHLPAAQALLQAVRHTPLTAHSRLCDIPPDRQSREWGFMLHAQQFSHQRLINWFAQHKHLPHGAAAHLHQLNFPTLNGFLNGFIDWIGQDQAGNIIIADFKSNHLGNQQSDYHNQAMNTAVSQHHYALQALIYAIAAARHFRRHRPLPESIAIRYLFIRGLNPHGTEGLWQWDIPTSSLQTWLDDTPPTPQAT